MSSSEFVIDMQELESLLDETAGSDGEREFGTAALAFLRAHAQPKPPLSTTWGVGPEHLELFHETSDDEERAEADAALAWQRTKFEAGFGWIGGPSEHGGGGYPDSYDRLFRILEGRFDVPDPSPIRIGIGTVGPALVLHGTSDIVEQFVRPLYEGKSIACQLFSEPGAGSDLAGVSTTAVPVDGGWQVNGQKVWTSNATFADIGLALVRTDPSAGKHAGLSMLLVDMRSPGVEVRPIQQMTGGASFTEVFLADVHVPAGRMIGEPGAGWSVATATLAGERKAVGDRSHENLTRAVELLRHLGDAEGFDDARLRRRWAEVAIGVRASRLRQQGLQSVPAEYVAPAERTADKLLTAANLAAIGDLAADLLGPRFSVDTGEWGTFAWNKWRMGALGYRIAGGTEEILKTLVAERVLGLPREPKELR
ncbi:acyl-CoA dehydrogenase family protein [Rhodococcus rhodochrous]|uniref:acyl-CoA dehydrogenase family protein n=1 Tax=Rhodococcus rhodochrous TaxID=1829 RepID=UPI001E49DD04|nr:acyl-CoA dehydrogenase family protein [Rhodococcus rhodochrous]MCB8913993.1 acyl-CoA dehydrogenase family protein [Rhodococcus rhodochrous]